MIVCAGHYVVVTEKDTLTNTNAEIIFAFGSIPLTLPSPRWGEG
jgi:hypothetical protein